MGKRKKAPQNYYNVKGKMIKVITSLIFFIVAVTFVVFVINSKNIFGYDWLKSEESSTAVEIGKWFDDNLHIILRTLLLVVILLIIIFLLSLIRKIIGTKSKKLATFISILFSILKWGLVIFVIMRILWYWGVDVITILAGLGIVALVVGLGCQSLISDVVAGVFLVVENAFEVGDIVVIDGFRGIVKEIGLKATKIEDIGGNVKLIQNSDISTVVNLTHVTSLAVTDVCIGYNEDVKKVEELIFKNMDKIIADIDGILEKPKYAGIDALTDSSVNLRFLTKCKEENRFAVERRLNRNFLIFLQENDITIPFTQITINESDPNHHKKERKTASTKKKD